MPIYEYRCGDCGHELEALQKISDPKLTTCPACGKEALTKLVSASAFVLKGSGWYATDFRDRDKPKSQKDEGKSEDKGESASTDSGSGDKADTKSGGKPESKSESKSDSSGDKKTKSEDRKSDSKPHKKAAGE